MNIAQHLEKAQRQTPNQIALIFEQRHYSYQELDQLANQVANGLSELGVLVGDRVGLFLPNIPEFMFGYLGIIKLGAIAVSLNVQLQSAEIQFIVNDSQATALITTPELAKLIPTDECPSLKHVLLTGNNDLANSLAEMMQQSSNQYQARTMQAHDPAAIVYSSGTTGFPKGVTLSHHNIISNMQAKNRYCDMRSSDRLLLCVPLFHCFGQNAIFNSALNAGATIVLHRSFNLDLVIRSIQADQVTMFFGVPTIYLLLLNKTEPEQLQPVRYFFSGAAILPVEIAQRWQAKYKLPIYEGYGLTETSPFAAYNHSSRYQLGSVGTPIEHVEIKIVDLETDVEVLPEQVGEIIIRGPNVMLGYWNNPAATEQAIRNGWFHTGDLGKKDQHGYLFIVDRLKDMINVAGLKVYPAEVENVIFQLPEIAEVAVYGVADAITGERVEAQVVFKPQQQRTIQEIIAFCRKQMASFKVPTAIKVVDSIPKNPTGKVLKRLLRNEAGA
ncbi:class I adenylate-forming enzyme family protein [Herpetosiphon geysericola]|uniref:AMP-dependent synthetase n=1 Tax=Herpetosiphon geysericola TaxID=70996 RepID=A0A0P6Z2L2_9CHLR|nr:long-chain-fatty-acid--CoA ligase [Herpetosiphon geysericola]KPL91449.1 AMP-dependent synthetase [Herpetosiphon geysericola]